MKILRGNLTETRYEFPDPENVGPMKIKSECTHKENAVAYMADELGVHRVWNRGSDFAVSLHRKITHTKENETKIPSSRLTFQTVYTPPNVAKGGCHVFDVNTGKSCHVPKCGNYSEYGRRL
jgi:hypothetical protein